MSDDQVIRIAVVGSDDIRGYGYFCSWDKCMEPATVVKTCILNGGFKIKSTPLCFLHGLDMSEYFLKEIKDWEERSDDQLFNWA